MPETRPEDALAAEFDTLMARAGLTIPLARRPAYLIAFADFRAQIALLHAPRGATAEPANVFRLEPPEGTR